MPVPCRVSLVVLMLTLRNTPPDWLLNVPFSVTSFPVNAPHATSPELFHVVPAPNTEVELKLVVDVAAVVSVNPPLTVPPVKLKVPPPGTVIAPLPVRMPPFARLSDCRVMALLIAKVPELCSSSMLPLVDCASSTLLVPLTVALMPLPARKVTVPAACEMTLLELPC